MLLKRGKWFRVAFLALILGILTCTAALAGELKTPQLAKALACVKIFSDLSAAERDALKPAAKLRRAQAGEHLTQKDKPLDKIIIVLDGKADVWVNGKRITTLSGQIIVGETEYLDGQPVFADVILMKEAELIELDNAALTRLMEREPRIGYVIMREIAKIEGKRLRDTTTAASAKKAKQPRAGKGQPAEMPVNLKITRRGETMTEIRKAPRRELFGWAMFDFANSSYTTVIITVVFCIIFPKLIVGDAPEYRLGNLLWSVSLSLSYLVVLLTAPILGAIMDYTASKKKFLFGSCLLTVAATSALYFVGPGGILLGMLLIILSNVGFSYSESFVSSFLPGLGPSEELGKISGYAWGLGYFGGLASTAIVIFGLGAGVYTLENFSNLRLVGPATGLFFLVAAIPTFLWVKERTVRRMLPPGENYLTVGFGRLKKTFSDIRDYKDLMVVLASFFFAYAGLSIVISFAFIYGDQVVKWSGTTQILMFVITQFTAAGGAFLFGILQDRWQSKRTFILTLLIWVIAVSLIYGVAPVTAWINNLLGASFKEEHVFLAIGCIAGLGLGSTQSACRAMVGLFSPNTKAGEFFGLWSFTSRLSAIFGLMGLGLLQTLFGLQKAVLVCSLFFFIAVVIVLFVDEERGKTQARRHAGEQWMMDGAWFMVYGLWFIVYS